MPNPLDRHVIALHSACEQYIRDAGLEIPGAATTELIKAAKAVVWFRYYSGDDGWEKLKEAIGRLENIVGKPQTEKELY
jgi:hypothetical protein